MSYSSRSRSGSGSGSGSGGSGSGSGSGRSSTRGTTSGEGSGSGSGAGSGESACEEVLKKFKAVRADIKTKNTGDDLYDAGAIFYTTDPVGAVTDYLSQNNKKFVDRKFKPGLQALRGTHDHTNERGKSMQADLEDKNDDIEWLRPHEWAKDPDVFVGGVDLGDIRQGATGDCWFLSMLCSIAHVHPETIEGCINPQAYNKYGVYSIGIFINGKRHFMLIDDRLPIYNKKPIFVKGRETGNELWFSFYEKSLAKWCGSYLDLSGSQITNHTVLCPEIVHLAYSGATAFRYFDAQKMDEDELINHIKTLSDQGFVITSGSKSNESGLHAAHAYSLLGMADVDGTLLVRLRNPWGHGEWTGKWADTADDWEGKDKGKYNNDGVDDGVFFMNLEDFRENFGNCYAIGPGVSFYVPDRERPTGEDSSGPSKVKGIGKKRNIKYKKRGHIKKMGGGGKRGICGGGFQNIDFNNMNMADINKAARSLQGGKGWADFRKNFNGQEFFKEIGLPSKGKGFGNVIPKGLHAEDGAVKS